MEPNNILRNRRRRRGVPAIAAALAAILTVLSTLVVALLPGTTVYAQDNRQKTKNDWRNLAIAAGGIGVLGLLKHDSTIALLGAAGGLYSLNRYEQDRKSQSQAGRARAEVYSHRYVYKDGKRYARRTVTRNGHRYYTYVRA